MRSKDYGGFWSIVWGVAVKPRGTLTRLVQDDSALKKGLLVWVLFFSLLGIFFIIFIDTGYPGTTVSTIPFNGEAIYSISIWCPPTFTLFVALVTLAFLALCLLGLGTSVGSGQAFAGTSFSLAIPTIFSTFVFFLLLSIYLLFGQHPVEFVHNWLRDEGRIVPIVFQVAGLIWMVTLLTLAIRRITGRGRPLSIGIGIVAASLFLAPHILFPDRLAPKLEHPTFSPNRYRYPLYPWKKDYHQSIVTKLKSRTGSGDVECNAQETLDQIRVIHNLSRDMPIIVYLSGWQQGGFDRQYPDLTKPGEHLVRPGIDSTPVEALRWLIEEAKKYNATVSLHINLQKATTDNDLYHIYKEQDLLCRAGVFNRLLYAGPHSAGYQTHRINTKLEWERGLTQKRIDDLMEMLPELQEIGTIHIDNFRPFPSLGHGTSPVAIMPYLKLVMAYFRDKYGVDVSSESTFNRRPNNDNLYGCQPWALSFAGMSAYSMRVPAYLYSGGRKHEDERFGSGGDLMPHVVEKDFNAVKEDLYTRIMPTCYLNRLIRVANLPETSTAVFSNDVVSVIPPEAAQQRVGSISVIRQGDHAIKDGTDVFMPALWRYGPEIVAYSKEGYAERKWSFPPDWIHVTAVDVYEIDHVGVALLESARPVLDNTITLSLARNQALAIVPAGVDVRDNPPIPSSGDAVFLGEDRDTGGSWIGTYGAEGYVIVGGEESLPEHVDVRYIGGEESTWTNSTTDQRALQRTDRPEDRVIGQRSTPIHEIVDVTVGNDAAMDVALYFVDWDSQQRQMIIDAIDANTNSAIHTVVLNEFTGGVYLNYRVKGRIQFRFTILGEDGNTFTGGDVTYSGVFFGAS